MSYGNRLLWKAKKEQQAIERLAPTNREGYLYYIKLKTKLGIFYKLGYTKSNSVQERFSYKGSENAQLIDQELLFVHLENAYDVESRLHKHFSARKSFGSFSANPNLPLYRSGQGELYYSDILGIDPKFSKISRFFTYFKVMLANETERTGHWLLAVPLILASVALAVGIFLLIAPIGLAIDWLERRTLKGAQQELRRQELIRKREVEVNDLVAEIRGRANRNKSSI